MGEAVKTETHSTVNKYASLETNKGEVGRTQNLSEDGQLHANLNTKCSSNMTSSTYQRRKEEIKSMQAALTNGVDLLWLHV
jgi:hypothetical protein